MDSRRQKGFLARKCLGRKRRVSNAPDWLVRDCERTDCGEGGGAGRLQIAVKPGTTHLLLPSVGFSWVFLPPPQPVAKHGFSIAGQNRTVFVVRVACKLKGVSERAQILGTDGLQQYAPASSLPTCTSMSGLVPLFSERGADRPDPRRLLPAERGTMQNYRSNAKTWRLSSCQD